MLNKDNRLKKKYQFNYVYKNGTRFAGKCLILHTTTSKTKNIKVGFAVTKKVGKAHTRNLVRRRLREMIRKQLPNLKQNFNIIIMAKDCISEFRFAEQEAELVYLLKKADLYESVKENI